MRSLYFPSHLENFVEDGGSDEGEPDDANDGGEDGFSPAQRMVRTLLKGFS